MGAELNKEGEWEGRTGNGKVRERGKKRYYEKKEGKMMMKY